MGLVPLTGFPVVKLVNGLVSLLRRERRFERKCASVLDQVLASVSVVFEEEAAETINEELCVIVEALTLGLTAHIASIRVACLTSLLHLKGILASERLRPGLYDRLVSLTFTLTHSEDDGQSAENLWKVSGFSLSRESFCEKLLDLICDESCYSVHEFAIIALGSGLESFIANGDTCTLDSVLTACKSRFRQYQYNPASNEVRRSTDLIADPGVEIRKCIAKFLQVSATSIARGFSQVEQVMDLLQFIIRDGLSDGSQSVKTCFNEAAIAILGLSQIGGVFFNELLKMFEAELKLHLSDELDEYLTIFIGTLAQHIVGVQDSEMVLKRIVTLLVQTLAVPSEPVQLAVSNCLGNLIRDLKWSRERVETLLKFFKAVLEHDASSTGKKRGAAFGITALVKGRGIQNLKDMDVMKSLNDWFESTAKSLPPRTLIVEDDWKSVEKF